jgi:hypothetical protein
MAGPETEDGVGHRGHPPALGTGATHRRWAPGPPTTLARPRRPSRVRSLWKMNAAWTSTIRIPGVTGS